MTVSPLLGTLVIILAQADDPLHSFTYSDVTLTRGRLADHAAHVREVLLALPEDDLLHGFRTRAGLPAPGRPMGGWYDPEGFAGAHPFGQFISGLARHYACTGDPRLKDKAARLIHSFHETIRADGFFYSSEKAFRDWGCYIYDKNCIGMRDAFTHCDNAEALVVLARITDWADPHMNRRNNEWYTLPENLYACYALTGEDRYLRMAAEFEHTAYIEDFASARNALRPELHAYSHVNALASIAAAHFARPDPHPRYAHALINAWDFLDSTQTFASGGWGPNEHFVPASGNTIPEGAPRDEDWSGCSTTSLLASLSCTDKHFETACGTYATVNAARNLLRITGNATYADGMERIILNGLAAGLPLQPDGRAFYYSNHKPGARKAYHPDTWTCCAGTPGQLTADYAIDTFFHTPNTPDAPDAPDALHIALFTPSELRWRRDDGPVTIRVETDFPDSPRVTITISAPAPSTFKLKWRSPAWCDAPIDVHLNGAATPAATDTLHWSTLDRTWREGDRIDLDLPMPLAWRPIDPAHPDIAALTCGPVLLVALAEGPVSITSDLHNPAATLRPIPGAPLTFESPEGTRFIPFSRITTEPYTTYCTLRGS